MRKSLVPIALAALFLLPAGALATRGAALKDGTLSVKGGVGMVYVNARGAVIGRVDKATRITIIDFVEDDGGLPVLQGCDTPETAGATDDGEGIKTSCSGNKIRFRLLGGGSTRFASAVPRESISAQSAKARSSSGARKA